MTDLLCMCYSHKRIELHGFSRLGEKRKAQVEMPKVEVSPNKFVVQYLWGFDVTFEIFSFFKKRDKQMKFNNV